MKSAGTQVRKLTLNNTRDNFVHHALATRTCLVCARELVVTMPILCSCGFRVSGEEIARHKAAALDTTLRHNGTKYISEYDTEFDLVTK
jgi:hypothetical protein